MENSDVLQNRIVKSNGSLSNVLGELIEFAKEGRGNSEVISLGKTYRFNIDSESGILIHYFRGSEIKKEGIAFFYIDPNPRLSFDVEVWAGDSEFETMKDFLELISNSNRPQKQRNHLSLLNRLALAREEG